MCFGAFWREREEKNAIDHNEVEAHVDDSKLISDGLQGDRNAFEILFSRYRPILYRLAQRILRNHGRLKGQVPWKARFSGN